MTSVSKGSYLFKEDIYKNASTQIASGKVGSLSFPPLEHP